MKKTIHFIAFALLAVSSFSACSLHNSNGDNLSFSVTDSDDYYKIKAEYDEDRTGEVQKYLNKSFSPNGIFTSEDDYMDINTELSDHTKLYLKSSPGNILIRINKDENSKESYERIKKIGEGLKAELAD
jgi:uncharacterized protein YxeA